MGIGGGDLLLSFFGEHPPSPLQRGNARLVIVVWGMGFEVIAIEKNILFVIAISYNYIC